MKERVVKEKSHSLVLMGAFNPPIFQPAWLGAQKLIREGEAEKAEIKIIHASVTQFNLPWGNIQVVPEKFIITASDQSGVELAKALVASIFRFLPHTPITALGINWHAHFQVEDTKTWNDIGHALIPKEPIWNKILKNPGTKSVFVQGDHEDASPGAVFVRIEPSNVYRPNGIYVDINDHYIIGDADKKGNGADAVRILESKWEASVKNSGHILEHLMNAI